MNIEVMFDRINQNICIIDDLMQSVSWNLSFSAVKTYFIQERNA